MQTLAMDQDLQAHVTKALGECTLFRALKPEHLPQLVKVAELIRYEPEDAILKQGDPSDSFYVLVRGEAAVSTEKGGESIEIGRVPLPSSVGEVGLLLGENRTASVVAKTEVLALKFGAKAFEAMFQKIPSFGASLSAGLAHRLQQVSGRVQLPDYDRGRGRPSAETVGLLPLEFVQRHRVLPLKQEGTSLTLGLVDDPNSQVLSSVRTMMPGADLSLVHVDTTFFNEVMGGLAGVEEWKAKGAAAAAAPAEVAAARSPRLDKLLERMVAEGASDVHLSARHKPQWRIDGDMHTIGDTAVLGPTEAQQLLEPVMEKRHREQFAADNDTDFAYSLPGVARFRVNMFRDNNGVGAVLRQIPSKIQTFEQLALPPVLAKLCDIPKGLVLVTGPTGSGKSTTLAAMIDYINRHKKSHVITLEDPIEFVHQSQSCLINQREVGGHTTTFARALRACLREDPDIVLVGEMRDAETVSLALETANTGHLVFATLHTNSAISAVDRIIDQFPADQQAQVRSVLSEVMRGVVAQTLCKKIGGGRMAVLEILVANYAVANLIREGKTNQLPSIMQANKALGMTLLNDELARLVETKKIEMAEAMSKAVDKDDLARRFRSGITLSQDQASGHFRVMAVVPASPGSEAGLERGDLVTEIDTKPSKDMGLDEARQMFRIDGKRLLVVERGGKRLKMTIELKR